MKCTGANKPLDTKAQVPIYPNRFRFLDFVDNGNNNNPQENNPLDRLLNLLHAIEENNQIEIIGRPNNNNKKIDINTPMLPREIVPIDDDYEVKCGRCSEKFRKARRCTFCGQLLQWPPDDKIGQYLNRKE